MRSLFALISLLLMPGLTPAQTMSADPAKAQLPTLTESSPRIFDQLFYSPATIGNAGPGQSANVMPLWSTPDGRVLAIVATGTNSGSLPIATPAPQVPAASNWKFIDVTDFVSSGVAVRLRDNVAAYASVDQGVALSPTYAAPAGIDCNAAFNATLDSRCFASSASRVSNGAVHLGTGATYGALDLDLSYGLSWVRANDQQRFTGVPQQPFWDLFSGMNAGGVPTLVIPGIELASVQNTGLNATGRWHFDENQSLDLSAAVGRIQLELPGNSIALPNINQAAFSLGVHHGDFSGVVIGHMLGPADLLNGGQRWSSVDLGISWRAPWRGVFSIGAQNVWSSGNAPSLIDPAAHETDASQSRVPYVQYHQDL